MATDALADAADESRAQQTPPGSPMDVDYEAGRRSPAPKSRTPVITVFDWDDTLCPSSWLFREGLLAGHGLVDNEELVPTEPFDARSAADAGGALPERPRKRTMGSDDKHALRVFEDHVLELLRAARQFGPVFIVTAAKLQWVRQCAENFLPNVLQVFTKSDSLHVISAREFYADQSRRMGTHQSKMAAEGTPLAWKTVAFEAVCAHLRVEEFVRRSRNNAAASSRPMTVDFVSIGDSLCERDACRFLALKAPTMLHGKTLKFLDQPKLLELLEQVKMTKALYEQICRYDGNLDLHVVRARASLQIIQLETPSPRGGLGNSAAPPVDQQARAELQRRSNAVATTAITATAVAAANSATIAPVSGPLTSL